MVSIPCPGQVQLSPPHTEYLGIENPKTSTKNEKINPKSAKIAQREGKRDPSIIYIPCPSQVKLSPPYIVNLSIACSRISVKKEKMHCKSNFLLYLCHVQ